MTPGERAARAAREAARKERLRGKAADKAQRRKARAAASAAKQKKGAPRAAGARPVRTQEPRPARREEPRTGEIEEEPEQRAPAPASRALTSRTDRRVVAILVALLVVAGIVALVLWKR